MSGDLILTELVGYLPGASNTTVLARDGQGRDWVYKPARGEQPLWDFEWQSLAAREVLTYEVSEAMGLGAVPETVMAVGPWGPGSAQRFVDARPDFDPRPLFRPVQSERLWPLAVLDLVTNNADRKLGHLLESSDNRLLGIDHGLTFHPEPKLRTVLWGFAGTRLPVEMIQALGHLNAELEAGLCARVEALLGRTEADALSGRIAALTLHPVHPEPPTDRPPVPWPLW